MRDYPRIRTVVAVESKNLLVTFENGVTKRYNCAPLLAEDPFSQLRIDPFFRAVQVDTGGYGIRWNDDIDLSESELWLHGSTVEPTPAISSIAPRQIEMSRHG